MQEAVRVLSCRRDGDGCRGLCAGLHRMAQDARKQAVNRFFMPSLQNLPDGGKTGRKNAIPEAMQGLQKRAKNCKSRTENAQKNTVPKNGHKK